MNVNYLGEALLGEEDAERRLQGYLAALQQPEIEVISVKISTIYSQISALAREHTIDVLCDRLELLFRAAAKARFTRRDGTVVPKFVYLDMEEYRDKELTAEVFMRTLDRPGLEQARAGIALQAYIPDSFGTQQRINEWARRRVAAGGAPVTIRLVKGANMEAERVEASLRGWPQAPYKTKLETDANYLRMLHEGMRPENLAAVRLGIASHNLFTLAYGLVLAARAGALDRVQFEMLEGMANHQRRALFELTGNMLLYAPACRQEDFTNAIGYLVRRLDENTGPDNFLRHAFNIEVDSPEWQMLEAAVRGGVSRRWRPCRARRGGRRIGGKSEEPQAMPGARSCWHRRPSANLRLLALPQRARHRLVAAAERRVGEVDYRIVARSLHGAQAADVPLVIGGEEIVGERRDARVARSVAAGRGRRPISAGDRGRYRSRRRQRREPMPTVGGRRSIAERVADSASRGRRDCGGARRPDGRDDGRGRQDARRERSGSFRGDRLLPVLRRQRRSTFTSCRVSTPRGQGVVVVVSPWNFPLAIPCGGVAAALAAGNTVILKPASDTVLIAYLLCECFWRAGVPRTALQFAPCSGGTVGQRLVTHDGVDAVILTGGTATAAEMLRRQADDESAGRNGRQECHDRHRAFRPRSGDQERAAQRVQPQRPEVLGHVAADSGKRSLSRRAVPRSVVRRGRKLARRLGVGTADEDRAADSAAERRAWRRGSRSWSRAKSGPSCRGCTSTTIRTW